MLHTESYHPENLSLDALRLLLVASEAKIATMSIQKIVFENSGE